MKKGGIRGNGESVLKKLSSGRFSLQYMSTLWNASTSSWPWHLPSVPLSVTQMPHLKLWSHPICFSARPLVVSSLRPVAMCDLLHNQSMGRRCCSFFPPFLCLRFSIFRTLPFPVSERKEGRNRTGRKEERESTALPESDYVLQGQGPFWYRVQSLCVFFE